MALPLLLISNAIFALDCDGTMDGAYVTSDDYVYILGTWRGDWTAICSLNQKFSNITQTACKAWFSTVQAAVISQSHIGE